MELHVHIVCIPQFLRLGVTLAFQPRLLRSRLSSGADFHDPSIFFCHTAGRCLANETDEQQRRYLAFDIDGLKAAAVAAVEGAKSVLHMTKRRVRIAAKNMVIFYRAAVWRHAL